MTSFIRRTLRRWGALLCVLAVFFGLAWVDARMKTAQFEGFCPDGAVWVAAAEDFASFCQGLDQCDLAARFPESLTKRLSDFQLRVRHETGVRPTSLRWRVWMGPTLLAAYDGRDTGFCVRPGLLMRGLDRARRVFYRIPAGQRINTFGPVYYAWREGFLIVSASRDYVAACLEAHHSGGARAAGPAALEPSQARNELRLHFLGPNPALLRIRGEDGLPVSGWILGDFTHRATPLTLAELVLGDPRPIFSVAATRWQDLRTFGTLMIRTFEYFSAISPEDTARVLQAMAACVGGQWHVEALPPDWDSAVQECAVGLFGIDTTEVMPVPELALILRCAGPAQGPHPLERLAPAGQTLPYEWEGISGVRVPWLGEKATFCLASAGRDWLLTTQEPLMAALLKKPRETAVNEPSWPAALAPPEWGSAIPEDADVAVRLEWGKAAGVAEAVLRQAARYELIPRMNSKDVEDRLLPIARAVAKLGRLELNARCREGRVLFDGYMARAEKGLANEIQ